MFALLFKYVPDAEIGWRDVWPGGLLTAVLFTLGKTAIGFYLGQASVGSAYGAAGSLVVLLVWVYYSALIIFFGAEFTHAWATRHSGVTPLSMWSIMPGGIPNMARPTASPRTLPSSLTRWPYLCAANINGQTCYGPFSSMPGSTYERGLVVRLTFPRA
jgi:membrane protein